MPAKLNFYQFTPMVLDQGAPVPAAFQAHFIRADDAHRLRLTIESMDQGTRSVFEDHAEFKTVLSQIGGDTDMEWARMHFERGLHKGIRHHVMLNAPP